MINNTHCNYKSSLMAMFLALMALLSFSLQADPIQLDETCVVSVLNRTVQASSDGAWQLGNVPTFMGQVRARATCVRDGLTISGQTDYFTIPANGNVVVGAFNEVENEPVPESIAFLSGNNAVLYGEQTYYRLRVVADYENGTRADITRRSSGINYSVSNPSIASIDDNGVLQGLASGRVLITARKDGVAAILALTVVTTGDQDEDGLPDDFERANGLDANDPIDALEDGDGDGVSAVDEYLAGTDINNEDTDGDGLSDGEEIAEGNDGYITNPLLADSDSDGISDSLEVTVGSDPTDINDYNLADSIQGISVDPSAIVLTYNTVVNKDTSAQLTVRGETLDGNTVDITRREKGTNYASSDLNICNFGGRDGEVFAGQNGDCIVTASNNGFSADADVEVRSFAPSAVSSLPLDDGGYNVDVLGDYAYVATGNGMRVMDISDRQNPIEIANLLIGTLINDIKVRGNYAYLAADAAGLLIVDVTYPDTPSLVGRLAYGGDAKDLQLYRDYALIAANDKGLVVVDISNPELPLFVNEVPTQNPANGVSWSPDGQVAVVAMGGYGIEVFEFPLTSTPVSKGTLNVSGNVQDVALKGDYAYLADYNRGLVVIDISDLSNPSEIGATNTTNVRNNRDIAIVGDFAILADSFTARANGAAIVDISDPAAPSARRILGLSAGGYSYGISIDSEYIYVASTSGFAIGQYVEYVDDNTISPTVAITTPVAGDTALEGGALVSTVQALDDIGVSQVQYFVNGDIVATDYVAPFEALVPMPAGVAQAELFVRAIDFGGNETDSEPVTIQLIPDSDLDGWSDTDELEIYGTSPYLPDSDNDGLQDRYEFDLGLNPLLRDEDQDGLVDGEEINQGEDGYITDPKDKDTDDDNLPDGYEVQYGLNPTDPSDASLDPDEDGLTTYEEFLAGSNPTSSDSDLDGMPDAYERLYGLDPFDPSDAYADLDDDGVPNIVEFDEQTDPSNPDVMAPQVAFVAPFDGDLVPVSTLLLVRFDEPLLLSSVNVDSVRLFDSEGAEFDGVVTLSSDGFLLTFNPTLYLPALADYELKVNDVRDLAGNPLAQEYTLSVSTSDQADTAGPTVSSSNPLDNSSGVPSNTTFSVSFNEFIDPTTLFSNNVYLRDTTSNKTVSGTVGITEEGNEIYFIPNEELLLARSYQLRVENIRDLSGNSCSNCYNISYLDFTTGFEGDETSPQIINTSVIDGQEELPLNAHIRVLFDEPVDGKSLSDVSLFLGEDKVQTNVGLSSGRNVLTLTPVESLLANNNYRLDIAGVVDRSGNQLTTSSLSFETGIESDTQQGTLLTSSPYNNAKNVPLNSQFSIKVSEPIDPLSLNNSSVRLYNQTTNKYQYGTHTLSENNTRITFVPNEPLTSYSDYQLRVSDSSSRSLLDFVGNRVAYGQYKYFSTSDKVVADDAGVYLVNIENETQDVPVNSRFAVWFDQYLDPVCARDAVLEINDGSSVSTQSVDFNGTTHVYAYDLGLEASTAYTLTLTGLCDYTGAAVPSYEMSFTTRADATEDTSYPRVTSITPVNNSSNVSLDSPIVITFDEAIQDYQGSAIRVETNVNGWTYIPGSTEIVGNTATFTPEDGFPPNRQIRVRLYRVRDFADNYYSSSWYYYFNTALSSDTTAPQVVSVTPEDGAMDITPGMPITVTFSEALNPSTVNNTNFVFWSNGTLIKPSVYRSGDSQRITLEANLPQGAPVALVMTDGVQDLSGNHLADYTSMFTTGVVSNETTRPSVVNLYPSGSSVHPDWAERIVLFTNEMMNDATLPDAIKVVQNGSLISGTVTALADAQAIEFVPDEPLEQGAYIQVFATSAARDLNDNALYSYQGTFTLRTLPGEAIGVAPYLESNSPSNWSTVNTSNPVVQAYFNEALDADTVNTDTVIFRKYYSGEVIPVSVELLDERLISIKPDQLLEVSTLYYAEYLRNGIYDTDGDALASSQHTYFYTSSDASEDTAAPSLLSLSPPDSSVNVPLNSPMHAIYDEVIDPYTFYQTDLYQSGIMNLSFGSSGRELRYQRAELLLPENSEITETIPAMADIAGNVGEAVSTSFTTASHLDLTRSTVVNRVPVSNATNVPVNTIISIEMNEIIDPASISGSSVYLRDTTNNQQVSISRSLDANGRTIVMVPTEALDMGRRYYAYTGGLKDLAGNSSYGDGLYFTTGFEEDSTAPEVTGTSIVDGQVDVPRNARINIRFSEAINGSTLDEGGKVVVTDASGEEVPYKWSLSGSHGWLTLTPRMVLGSDETYTVTVQNVADRASNIMEATKKVSFKTSSSILTTLASIVISPADNLSLIPLNTIVSVKSPQILDVTTVNTSSIRLYDATDSIYVSGSISLSEGNTRINFIPDDVLVAGHAYRIYVSYYQHSNLLDLIGNRVGNYQYDYFDFVTGANEDDSPPSVSQVGLEDGLVGVSVNSRIRFKFNERVNIASISNRMVLSDSVGNIVDLSWSIDHSRNLITFSPLSPLSSEETYSYTLNGMEDLAGNELSETISGSFSTGQSIDEAAGTLLTISPLDNETNVPTNAQIDIVTSERFDPSTVDKYSVRIYDATDGVYDVSGSFAFSDNNTRITFRPDTLLDAGHQYRIYVSYYQQKNIMDLAGNRIGNYQHGYVDFTTGSGIDENAPKLQQVGLEDGLVDAPLNSNIRFQFDEKVNTASIVSHFVLQDSLGNIVDLSWSVDQSRNLISFTPLSPLSSEETYSYTLNGMEDLAGNKLSETISGSFTTEHNIDETAGTLLTISPLDNETGVPTNAQIDIVTSERFDPSTVDKNSVRIYDATDGVYDVSGSFVFSDNNTRITFRPDTLLDADHQYRIYVSYYQQKNITDLAGNRIGNYQHGYVDFTTGSAIDESTPKLQQVGLEDGLIDVPLNSNIRFRFDEKVNTASIVSRFLLQDSLGNIVPENYTVNGTRDIVTLTPATELEADETYNYRLNGIEDLAGNIYTEVITGSFTMSDSSDIQSGTLFSTSPADNALNVPVDTQIEIVTNERFDPATVNNHSVRIYDESDGAYDVPGTFVFTDDNTRITFIPDELLDSGHRYRIYVSHYQHQNVTDLAGNRIGNYQHGYVDFVTQ